LIDKYSLGEKVIGKSGILYRKLIYLYSAAHGVIFGKSFPFFIYNLLGLRKMSFFRIVFVRTPLIVCKLCKNQRSWQYKRTIIYQRTLFLQIWNHLTILLKYYWFSLFSIISKKLIISKFYNYQSFSHNIKELILLHLLIIINILIDLADHNLIM
jgi:hypothetical protein